VSELPTPTASPQKSTTASLNISPTVEPLPFDKSTTIESDAFAPLDAVLARIEPSMVEARAAGGEGAFEVQVYLASFYSVPLNFVAIFGLALNNVWSGVGFVSAFATVFYQIVLTVPMLRVVHGAAWHAPWWLVILIALVGNLVGGGIGAILPQ